MTSRGKVLVAAGVVLLGVLVFVLSRRGGGASTTSASIDGGDRSTAASIEGGRTTDRERADASSLALFAIEAGAGVRLAAKWGSGTNELGRERPREGNPEGPMSFALAGDGMIVVDQINGRLAKYDAKGRLERTIDATQTVQDVAVGEDGSMAALDRLSQKNVSLYDPNGRKIGELPLSGGKVGETGLLTGVFVDGKDVYVEKEHGVLVHVGTTDGQPADEAKELVGRPTKDGSLMVSAVLPSPRDGRAMVNAVDRKTGSLRFARAVQFPRPARSIVLLDSDAQGTIYLGVAAGPAPGVAEIACMDPSDGHVTGRVDVQISATPEESFRDFAVSADGTIVWALRSDDGVEYRSARCP
jgi:hypothetical protein